MDWNIENKRKKLITEAINKIRDRKAIDYDLLEVLNLLEKAREL